MYHSVIAVEEVHVILESLSFCWIWSNDPVKIWMELVADPTVLLGRGADYCFNEGKFNGFGLYCFWSNKRMVRVSCRTLLRRGVLFDSGGPLYTFLTSYFGQKTSCPDIRSQVPSLCGGEC